VVNLCLSNRLVRDVWDQENLNFKDIIYIYMHNPLLGKRNGISEYSQIKAVISQILVLKKKKTPERKL